MSNIIPFEPVVQFAGGPCDGERRRMAKLTATYFATRGRSVWTYKLDMTTRPPTYRLVAGDVRRSGPSD